MFFKVKEYFSGWNLFEKLYLFGGITIAVISTLIFKGSVFNLVYTITYLTNAILSSKGKVESYIFGFIGIFFYGYISYNQRYYGELIISIVLSLPMLIIGLREWLKNQDIEDDVIIISTLSKKEVFLVFLSQIFMFWGYYFLLKAFNTELLVISSLSIVASSLAIYFGARRSELAYYCYIANDFIIFTLWLIPIIINGETPLMTVLIGPILLFINDVYGVYNWKRLKKKQKEKR